MSVAQKQWEIRRARLDEALSLVMPNSKELRDCEGADIRDVPGWENVAKFLPKNKTVGEFVKKTPYDPVAARTARVKGRRFQDRADIDYKESTC
jgi:hypothetical protein